MYRDLHVITFLFVFCLVDKNGIFYETNIKMFFNIFRILLSLYKNSTFTFLFICFQMFALNHCTSYVFTVYFYQCNNILI